MRIESLSIQGERLLNSLEVDFSGHYPLTVLLGGNGSGKSILLEALARVFVALEDAKAPEFAFQIRYVCNGYTVEAGFNGAGKFSCQVQAAGSTEVQDVPLQEFREKGSLYLPNFIFGYHSGRGERLERIFAERDQLYFQSIARDEKAILEGQDDWSTGQSTGQRSAYRRFRYVTNQYMPLGLLSLLLNQMSTATEIKRDILGLGELESILLTFRRPERAQDGAFFWGVAEEYVEFLQAIWQAAWLPMHSNTPEWKDGVRRGRQTERLQLYLPDAQTVSRLVERFGSAKYCINRLDQLLALGLLERVTVRLHHRGKPSVPDHQLSEGEQQFITVLGAVLSAENSESLHLLDEPDSHLNPRWAHDYVHHLTSAFQAANPDVVSSDMTETSDAAAFGTDQVLLATHNPLTIGPLTREQVRVLSRTVRGVTAEMPKYDPKGVGADGLLKMDLFGLETTLDKESWEMVKRHYYLMGKADLTEREKQELQELGLKISELPISRTHPNPYFERFAEALARHDAQALAQVTHSDAKPDYEFADAILAEVLGKKG